MVRVLAITAAAGISLTGLTLAAAPANAATQGAGFDDGSSFGGHLGNEITPDGKRGYCADPSRDGAFGDTDGGQYVTSFTADAGQVLQGDDMTKVNYVLLKYGDTGDDVQAAAVNAYIYAYTGSHLGGGISPGTQAEGAAYISASHPEVTDEYNTIWADADANWNSGGGGTGSGTLDFAVVGSNFDGTVTADVQPSTATGAITLTNGVFTATGSSSVAGVTAGETLDVHGAPPAGVKDYQISGSGTFTGPSTGSHADSNVAQYNTGSEQRLLVAGTSTAPTATFTVSGHDPFARSAAFAPIVGTTVASTFVDAGATPQDNLTFSTTSFQASSGRTVTNPWAKAGDGSYVPIVANGTLYWSTAAFTESDTAPAGSVVLGHASVTTTAADGPNKVYTASSDTPATQAGYSTWVWAISAADQSADAQTVLPDGYSFTDKFGQVAESHITPSRPTLSTTLSDTSKVLGGSVTDAITPTLVGGDWLRDSNGTPIPVTLSGAVYHSDKAPVQASTVPADAVKIGTATQILAGGGTVTSSSIDVGYAAGYDTVVWALVKADQPAQYQGYFADWSDNYGVPAETAQILTPTVTTKAQADAAPGGTVQDTATITGPMPTVGVDVTFKGYLQKDGSTSPVCDASTLTYTSTKPVTATTAGDYPSEAFPVADTTTGKVFWIETASVHGTTNVISTGKCGVTSEQTVVAQPTVVTAPPTGLSSGATAHDTLTVNGQINPGTTAVVTLYKQATGAATLVCDTSTQVDAISAPIAITAGFASDASYTSAETDALVAGNYGFVEQLLNAKGVAIVTGGCLDELFPVSQPTVVTTPPSTLTAGSTATDTLVVNGTINPGTTAVVSLYKQGATNNTLVCDATSLVTTLPAISITAGPNANTSYTSPATGGLDAGNYGFVEQLIGQNGKVIVQGGCTEELFNGSPGTPVLAHTGFDAQPLVLLAGGLLAGGGVLFALFMIRRRRSTTAE
ncbi:hypothetical protein D4765_14010 [Subtercola vilae]|uniref:LPXTG cell wall anchor domain-containing protein n=2 Tax=Subtercola vilae TaxID=2056433 RepID=A0A4T2BQ34_9MICO|nr:hypothetical protein D4765_14010 [Subtercola vilae]